MRQHPIPPVTEPMQYRAIGLVRGTYRPADPQQLTRGVISGMEGDQLDAVLLGRIISLVRRHVDLSTPHLWVCYPRTRLEDQLHLQVMGIWEPSKLDEESGVDVVDDLPEGDGYFSVRGELVFTRPEAGEAVIKIRQLARADGNRPQPFKLQIKGEVPPVALRHFVAAELRRAGQDLTLEDLDVIGPIPRQQGRRGSRAGRGRGGGSSSGSGSEAGSRARRESRRDSLSRPPSRGSAGGRRSEGQAFSRPDC